MKKIIAIVFCITIMTTCFVNIYAVTDPGYNENLVNSDLRNKTKNIWGTISVIVQLLSVGCVVFAGLRYMFASADQRADIKQGLIYLTIGAVLVFGAVRIINLVAVSAKNVIVLQ